MHEKPDIYGQKKKRINVKMAQVLIKKKIKHNAEEHERKWKHERHLRKSVSWNKESICKK